ncbi:MAG TPA: Mrp/NBP35 family ATP-binding protein [Candidatus Hydrogenedentes bacterium]|nr:Mrp/NBP35 family ATP-binding protein [Candidatus Hydrogenedentota bacterium]
MTSSGAAARGSACADCDTASCATKTRRRDESDAEFAERQQLESRLCRIRHTLLVLSGKGGVGKSTVSVNLAVSLVRAGLRVGLLDIDIHGPSIPTMLGLDGAAPCAGAGAVLPVERAGLKVMSIGFFLSNRDDAVIWRGPMKMGVIKQFLKDVEWGDLDCLIIDSPPGTGDEPLSVCQLVAHADGAVVVTTPQRVATADVRRSITFCRKLGLPVLGVVENMSGFVCPQCGATTAIFQRGGGERMAGELNVPFLGGIPMDPRVVEASDAGTPCVECVSDSPVGRAFDQIGRSILDLLRTSSRRLPHAMPGDSA